MRAFAVFMALILLCLTLQAQTNVEKLVRNLDTLTTFNYNDWKASPDLRNYRPAGDPTMPGFDDSKWDNLRIHARIRPDSCWLRKEITLPEQVLGQKVTGAVKLLLTVDDAGYLWVDGRPMGYFPWDGEFELTKDPIRARRSSLRSRPSTPGDPCGS